MLGRWMIILVFVARSNSAEKPNRYGKGKWKPDDTSYQEKYELPSHSQADRFDGPHIVKLSENLTVPVGSTAYLHCVVKKQGDHVVAWIRNSDNQLLATDRKAFVANSKFELIYWEDENDYCLRIQNVSRHDSGEYTCMLGTDPPTLKAIQLTVPEIKAKITGYGRAWPGKKISLRCLIELPVKLDIVQHVRWYHNDRLIFSSQRIQVYKPRLDRDGRTIRTGIDIFNTQPSDGGNYTCSAPGISPEQVAVHVNDIIDFSSMQREQPDADKQTRRAQSSAQFSLLHPVFYLVQLASLGYFMEDFD